MPSVSLQKVDSDNVSYSFNVGEHILGRGDKLQCLSKKVSRNHGLLKVTNNEGVSLKSIHNNPCFYKTEKSPNISLLTFGNTIELSNNDKIALCLDHGWFSVVINEESEPNKSSIGSETNELDVTNNIPPETNDETVTSPSLKRNGDEIENSNAKKLKPNENKTVINPSEIKTEPENEEPSSSTDVGSSDLNEQVNTNQKTNEVNLNIVKTEKDAEPNSETGSRENEPSSSTNYFRSHLNPLSVKQENVSEETNEVNLDIVKTENEAENVKVEPETDSKTGCKGGDEPSTSGVSKKPWRDRCWYGKSCYRKNGQHRIEFKHPGDSDFDSDADDTRPICCYGPDCYRKNREHRKRYRHPGQVKLGTRPAPQLPQRRVVRPLTQPMSQNSDEMDDYDLNDPFIDDGSEDEYEPSQDVDTESDYEDSQEAEEDTKALLKEAKKFTRNKK